MQKTSNFPQSPYYFKGTLDNSICKTLVIPKFLALKIFFDLFELGHGSLQSIGALRGTSKFMWNVANAPALWKLVHKSLPLPEYDNCKENDYYNLCKQYNIAAKNVGKNKYWLFEHDSNYFYTKNIFSVKSEIESNYICNLFLTEFYKIDEEKCKWDHFGKFLINHKEKELEILDLSSNKTQFLNLENDYITGDHTLDELNVSMPNKLMCFENFFFLSLEHDAKLKKIYTKIWDIRTGKSQRTKEILDTSKSQRVVLFCKELPYIRKEGQKRKAEENPTQEISIYDTGKGKHYSYSFQLYNNEDVALRAPYITDSYIVYCGIDNVLTFLNRKSEKVTYIDLGDKNTNLIAISILREMIPYRYNFDKDFAEIHPKEIVFIYYDSTNHKLAIWDLLTGKKICEDKHKLVHTFENQIVLYDGLTGHCIFYDLTLKEKFVQQEECMFPIPINSRYQFINIPDQYDVQPFTELEKIQIHDTGSNAIIALEIPKEVVLWCCKTIDEEPCQIISALWENFLAVPAVLNSEKEGDKDHILIFDICKGEHLGSIPISLGSDESDDDYITDLKWFNGCLRVEHEHQLEAEVRTSFIYIAFQEKNPFPPRNCDNN